MKYITKQGDNMGGIANIWAIPTSDIELTGNVLTMISTDNLVAIYATPDTIGFKETSDEDASGSFYNVELVGKTPKGSEETDGILENMRQRRRWAVIYLDNNEQYKVLGADGVGVKFSVNFDTGTQTSEYNGHVIRFYGKQTTKARFIINPFL